MAHLRPIPGGVGRRLGELEESKRSERTALRQLRLLRRARFVDLIEGSNDARLRAWLEGVYDRFFRGDDLANLEVELSQFRAFLHDLKGGAPADWVTVVAALIRHVRIHTAGRDDLLREGRDTMARWETARDALRHSAVAAQALYAMDCQMRAASEVAFSYGEEQLGRRLLGASYQAGTAAGIRSDRTTAWFVWFLAKRALTVGCMEAHGIWDGHDPEHLFDVAEEYAPRVLDGFRRLPEIHDFRIRTRLKRLRDTCVSDGTLQDWVAITRRARNDAYVNGDVLFCGHLDVLEVEVQARGTDPSASLRDECLRAAMLRGDREQQQRLELAADAGTLRRPT